MPGFVGGAGPGFKPIFQLITANMNSTADQSFVQMGAFSSYVITDIVAANASASLTLAAGGIYQAASKAGTAIVAAAQVYSALTAATKTLGLTVAVSDVLTATPILSLTIAQGGAATADIRIYGYVLS